MVLLAVWLTGLSGAACAASESTLRKFERDATDVHSTGKAQDEDDDSGSDSILGRIVGAIFEGFFNALLDGPGDDEAETGYSDALTAEPAAEAAPGSETQDSDVQELAAAESPPEESVNSQSSGLTDVERPQAEVLDEALTDEPKRIAHEKWEPGSGATPRFRLDYSGSRVTNRISATSIGIEVGGDTYAFHASNTRFEEHEPDATLDVRHYYLQLHHGENGGEIALGLGVTDISGDESNYGLGVTLPVRIVPAQGWAFEWRPVWTSINGNDVSDNELAACIEGKYWAVRGGYRWLKSPHMLLDGPFAGVSVRY